MLLVSAVPVPLIWLLDGFDLNRMLALEAVVLAVSGVAIAIQHTGKLEDVADELRLVARTVPTRGLGVFPRYLAEVPGLIDRATESITILCDTPAHGSFSNTAAFVEYWTALRRKMVDGVTIECAFFDADGRRELHGAQIDADREDWDAWKARNGDNCRAFDHLAQKHGIQPPGDGDSAVAAWANTPDDFIESMMAINDTVLSGFDRHLTVVELGFENPLRDGPSVYFWRRDGDQEAVFVIVPVQGIGVRDLTGFHTREPELIRALGTVFDHPGGRGGSAEVVRKVLRASAFSPDDNATTRA